KNGVTGKTNYNPLTAPVSNSRNQVDGYCYDGVGNLLQQTSCSTPVYSYDQENRLNATGGVAYTYDGNGERVKKSSGKLYWRGLSGATLLETDLNGNNPAEFIFFNGRRIERRDPTIGYYCSTPGANCPPARRPIHY